MNFLGSPGPSIAERVASLRSQTFVRFDDDQTHATFHTVAQRQNEDSPFAALPSPAGHRASDFKEAGSRVRTRLSDIPEISRAEYLSRMLDVLFELPSGHPRCKELSNALFEFFRQGGDRTSIGQGLYRAIEKIEYLDQYDQGVDGRDAHRKVRLKFIEPQLEEELSRNPELRAWLSGPAVFGTKAGRSAAAGSETKQLLVSEGEVVSWSGDEASQCVVPGLNSCVAVAVRYVDVAKGEIQMVCGHLAVRGSGNDDASDPTSAEQMILRIAASGMPGMMPQAVYLVGEFSAWMPRDGQPCRLDVNAAAMSLLGSRDGGPPHLRSWKTFRFEMPRDVNYMDLIFKPDGRIGVSNKQTGVPITASWIVTDSSGQRQIDPPHWRE